MEKLETEAKQEGLKMKGGFFSKLKNRFLTKLYKKAGVSALVVELVIVALAVGLCIIFRNTLFSIMTTALASLSTQVTNLLAGTVK